MRHYFEIGSERKLKLAEFATKLKHPNSPKDIKFVIDKNHKLLEEHQALLYANEKRSMLIIFQGMDAAGKDGAIKHVMSGVNPQGCSVVSFKTPSSTELSHDFLWRSHTALPSRGRIGIFNRSYYEEVLITQVHPELLKAERLPTYQKINKEFWQFRYHDIINYEKFLHRQGYEIIKIFLHISKEEQKRRLLSRFEDPKKLWKISPSDISERAFWRQYQEAYAQCIGHTSSKSSPWYIVPGDDKVQARMSISEIIVERFKRMKLDYPELSHQEKDKLRKLRHVLEHL